MAGTDGNSVAVAINTVAGPADVFDPKPGTLAEVVLIAHGIVVNFVNTDGLAVRIHMAVGLSLIHI